MDYRDEILFAIKDCREKEEVMLAAEAGIMDVLRHSALPLSPLVDIYERREVLKDQEKALKAVGRALGSLTACRRELESKLPEAEYGLFETDDNGEIQNILLHSAADIVDNMARNMPEGESVTFTALGKSATIEGKKKA
jgi:hypothetical protein